MKRIVKNPEIFLHIILFIVLFFISSYKIFEKPGLWFGDEFGYSGTAAWLGGMDWSNQIKNLSYYGVGYGILLVPAYRFCSSAKQIMQYIGCLNIFLFLLSFELVIRFCKIIFMEENKFFLYVISFLIMLYPNNIVQLQMSWTETLNLAIYWININVLINLFLKNTTISYIFLALIQCYSLMVHMRNIGFVAATMLVVFLHWILLKKLNIKKILIFLLFMILGLFTFWISKKYIQSVLWNNSLIVQNNDVSGIVFSIQKSFQLKGAVINFVKSIICKYFYIVASSYCLVIFGIIYAFKMIVNKSVEMEKRLITLYSILSFLFCFFLCSYSMMWPSRVDAVIYGRYFETSIGALLVFAFYGLSKDYKISSITKKACIILFGMFIGALVAQSLINNLGNALNIYVCIAGLGNLFFKGYNIREIIIYICLICTFYFSIAISCVLISLKCKRLKYVSIICFGCIISFFWLKTAKEDLDRMVAQQNQRYDNITPISETILENKYTFKSNKNIYYFQEMDEEWNEYLLGLQLMIGKNTLLNVNYDNWDSILETQPYFIVTANGYNTNDITLIDDFQNNYIPVSATEEFILYKHSEMY